MYPDEYGMKKESRQFRQAAPLCAYCGQRPSSTKDHVIPKQLFTVVPNNIVTVRSCDDCNQEKKSCDEYLHDWLVLDWQGSEHQVARERFAGPLWRAISRQQSDLIREIAPKIRVAPQYNTAGLYLGDYPSAPIDGEKLQRAMAFIVRGLTFKSKKERIPDDYTITMDRIDPLNLSRALENMMQLGASKPFVLGDKVVMILRVPWANYGLSCIWMFIFYRLVMLRVFVESPELTRDLKAEREKIDQGPAPNPEEV
jgi:hypothetical protein